MITSLHEQWGDWLVTEKKGDGAINHYIEAGAVMKAIDAAIASRQWSKAEQLLESTHGHKGGNSFASYYEKIAGFYEKSRHYDQ
jgi:intraflagellar transport protein 172